MLDLINLVKKGASTLRVMSKSVSLRLVTLLAMLAVSIAEPTFAQSFDLPTVEIDGVDENTPVSETVWAVIKYGVQFVLWVLVVIAGVVLIKNVLKSIAKVRRDEDGKWGDVVGEAMGNAIVVILLIALATAVTTWLN